MKARRFVIAAGSAPAVPPIPGLDAVPYLTNETIFDLKQCPEHLLVIGAGPIGLELAQAFRRLGAEVTVLEAATPLAKDDPECAQVVLDQLSREGIALRTGVKVVRVEKAGTKVRAVLETAAGEQALDGSHLLVATGRRPNVEGLGLEAAGIRHEKRGIVVNGGLVTSNRKVFAIGDVVGAAQFTHVANYHAGIVIRRALFRLPTKVDEDVIPWVTYTDPELAHVGLTEAAARKRHRAIRVLRAPFHDNDRAQTERVSRGHVKVVTTQARRHHRRHHRGAACRRADHHVDAGDPAGAQHPRRRRAHRSLSDLERNRKACGNQLLYARFDAPHCAAHHHVHASLRMRIS